MPAKPLITLVGAGNLGTALAIALRRADYSIDSVVARSRSESLQRAQSLARQVGATAVAGTRAHIRGDVVWFCVPDGQISRAAHSMKDRGIWKGKVALHSSGALTSDELSSLRQRGASVASAHPLMTFVRGSYPSLIGVPFAIEGDATAVRVARKIVTDLRGHAFPIRKRDKAAYHAWGTFASPLLTALLAATERVALRAGVTRTSAKQRMLPIIAQTVANYAALGAARSFSGPIVRGDGDTVKTHLLVLQRSPLLQQAYIALAKASLEYLPAKQRAKLQKILTFE